MFAGCAAPAPPDCLASQTCGQCVDNCVECSAEDKCLRCFDGFALFEEQCVQSCPTGYRVSDGATCEACPENCEVCDGAACLGCAATHFLQQGACHQRSPSPGLSFTVLVSNASSQQLEPAVTAQNAWTELPSLAAALSFCYQTANRFTDTTPESLSFQILLADETTFVLLEDTKLLPSLSAIVRQNLAFSLSFGPRLCSAEVTDNCVGSAATVHSKAGEYLTILLPAKTSMERVTWRGDDGIIRLGNDPSNCLSQRAACCHYDPSDFSFAGDSQCLISN